MRTVLRRIAVGGAVVVATVVAPAAARAPAATCAAQGEIRVRIVVDFGGAAGAPSGVSDVCVPVADRSDGAELLAARARQLGTPAPRFEGGFLCGIDGFPEQGCGNASGEQRYWSYWHGEKREWAYSNVGAATWTLRDGDVEGWRFVDGSKGESAAAPPRADAASCPVPAPVAAPTTATTTPAATAPANPGTTLPAAVAPTTTGGAPDATTTTTSTSTTARPRVENAAARRDDSDDGAPVGLAVVGAAIVALGAAAGLRFRAGRRP